MTIVTGGHGLIFKKAIVYLRYEIQLHAWEYHHLVNIVSASIKHSAWDFSQLLKAEVLVHDYKNISPDYETLSNEHTANCVSLSEKPLLG